MLVSMWDRFSLSKHFITVGVEKCGSHFGVLMAMSAWLHGENIPGGVLVPTLAVKLDNRLIQGKWGHCLTGRCYICRVIPFHIK